MKIQFIVPKENRGWAYPLIKWKKNFQDRGLSVRVLDSPELNTGNDREVIILTSRYYRNFFSSNDEYFTKGPSSVKEDVEKLRNKNTKVVFYDLSASTGSRDLEAIRFVDLFLKRQLYKDRSLYLSDHPYRLWVEDKRYYPGCNQQDLGKLQLGWNLGYQDYNPYWFNSRLFKLPSFRTPDYHAVGNQRAYTASYRGKMGGQTIGQRQAVKETLMKLSADHPKGFLTGGIVKKSQFIAELRNSKASVSPFGYGEICYRDMEAFINGCLLLKPSMDHLETFPDFFKKNETYLPLEWDLSDLQAKLLEVHEDYEKFRPIAEAGQSCFQNAYDNFDHFYRHFTAILDRLEA